MSMAALSGITSGSTGQELFTDETRGYTFFEDAYAGFVTGRTDEKGNRLAFNFSAGRQRFTLANAFLIANTAANGEDRAALQANARWAADFLVLGAGRLQRHQVSRPSTSTPTNCRSSTPRPRLAGLNIESRPVDGLMLGASYLTAPQSDYSLFQPARATVIGTREGLNVFDARFT